jgi:hypothetical protein
MRDRDVCASSDCKRRDSRVRRLRLRHRLRCTLSHHDADDLRDRWACKRLERKLAAGFARACQRRVHGN